MALPLQTNQIFSGTESEKYLKALSLSIDIMIKTLVKLNKLADDPNNIFNYRQSKIVSDYTSALLSAIAQEKKLLVNEDDIHGLSEEKLKEMAERAFAEMRKQ